MFLALQIHPAFIALTQQKGNRYTENRFISFFLLLYLLQYIGGGDTFLQDSTKVHIIIFINKKTMHHKIMIIQFVKFAGNESIQ